VLSEAHWDDNPIRFMVQQRKNGEVVLSKAFTTRLLGEHNLQNSLGCIATLRALNALSLNEIERALAKARGLRRRLEAKGDACQIPIFEDLSSSRPKAVAALRAIRQHRPKSRIFAVFQPHTFSFRSRKALEWYPEMFAEADTVLVFSPPNLRGLATSETLSHDEILAAIAEGNRACTVLAVRDAEEILDALLPHITPQDALLFMTSGGMDAAIDPVIARLESVFPREQGA
jgi:UDP-N-acetylmuramate: L-alanyl-gamma-D-glutamyl-meso-diaminopimelate ligase